MFVCEVFNGFRGTVEDYALVTSLQKSSNHVRAHSSKSDHSNLHDEYSLPLCRLFSHWPLSSAASQSSNRSDDE